MISSPGSVTDRIATWFAIDPDGKTLHVRRGSPEYFFGEGLIPRDAAAEWLQSEEEKGHRVLGVSYDDGTGAHFGGFVSFVDRIKDFFGIHSPSTLFAGIGENMGVGLGMGFTDAMVGVEKDITAAIPTNFNINTGLAALSSDAMTVSVRDNNMLTQILNVLERYMPVVAAERQVILDTGATVGALAKPMDRAIGNINPKLRGR